MTSKISAKQEREYRVLTGLINEFIKTAKPVGSNTLREAGFDDLSSATIRNYFASLEQQGYLTQQHTSGGRLPTPKAFRYFAETSLESGKTPLQAEKEIKSLKMIETKEISSYLQNAAETLGKLTNYAIFLSAPRFDHDFVADVRLIPIDKKRFLCVQITDFGQIYTQLIHNEKELNCEKLESYFRFRISGENKPKMTNEEEAQKLYNEAMVRYVSSYSSFTEEDIYRTGFSNLLAYPDFHDTGELSSALSLFENTAGMRLLLKECLKRETLLFWIGEDLKTYIPTKEINCSVIATPFCINKQPVGSIGLLGPIRMPYSELFGVMRELSNAVSTALTNSLYKHKISFRQPEVGAVYLQKEERQMLGKSRLMLLEDKSED